MPAKDPITTGPAAGGRIRGFIYWAFLISIGVHFLIGPLLPRFDRRHEQEKVEQVSVEKKIKVVVKQTPPPTPPPTPTPPPQKQTPPPVKSTPAPVQPKIKINTVKTTNDTKNGPSEKANTYTQGSTQGNPNGTTTAAASAAPVSTPAPTPLPTSTPTAKPQCANPNVKARTVNPVTPDTPEMARQQGATGVAQVEVDLSATSKVVAAKIYKSAGNQSLDQAAVSAAKQSTFQTDIINCVPQAASYIYVVEFQ